MTGIQYRSDIQGLRAIAVLAVMVFHFNPALLPGGFVGVDIFLVISGFLIASILFNKKEQENYQPITTLTYFYISRFKRLAPAYFVTLIVVSLFAAVLFLPTDFKIYKDGLEKAAYFNSNNYFANFGDYFAPANHEQPLLHTWSLALEVQFYLIAPFIFLLLPKRLLNWLLPISIIVLTTYAEYRLRILGQEQATYYSLSARIPAFFIGAWVALLVGNKNYLKGGGYLSWLAALLIITALCLPKLTGYFPGLAGLMPIIGAALLILNRTKNLINECLSSKQLVWFGAISYSLYLWHWPILAIIRYYTGAEILSWQYSLAFIVLTLLLASASYYWVEKPMRVKRNRKQIIGYSCLATLAILTAADMKKISDFYTPESLPAEYTRYADPKSICNSKIVGDCLKGDLTSDKEVLVLGDSHAAMLNHFFDYLGKELSFKARIITASSCVTIPDFDYLRIPELAQKSCLSQIEKAKEHLAKADTVFLAASWNNHLKNQNFKSALSSFLQRGASQAKIFIMSQEPLLKSHPLRNLRFTQIGMGIKAELNNDYLRTNKQLESLTQSNNSTYYLELDTLDVFKQAPFYNEHLIYFDEHHLNEVGAIAYARQAKDVFEKKVVLEN